MNNKSMVLIHRALTALTALLVFAAAQSAHAVESVQSARSLNIGPAYSGSSVNVANRRHAMFTHDRTHFAAYCDADRYGNDVDDAGSSASDIASVIFSPRAIHNRHK